MCFERYSDVMGLFEFYRERLSLDLHVVRYEDLVGQFDDTVTSVFEFLEIHPDDSYKNFHSINESKLIATPSRSQVVRPVYASSRYKWVNYSGYIRAYEQHVERFVELYGYAADV